MGGRAHIILNDISFVWCHMVSNGVICKQRMKELREKCERVSRGSWFQCEAGVRTKLGYQDNAGFSAKLVSGQSWCFRTMLVSEEAGFRTKLVS